MGGAWLVVCMLACMAATPQPSRAQVPNPLTPASPPVPDSPGSEQGLCEMPLLQPLLQKAALCAFYHSLGGPYWTNNTGWAATCDSRTEMQIIIEDPGNATSGQCQVSQGSQDTTGSAASTPVRFSPVPKDELSWGPSITLPDVCCWAGVVCCLKEVCHSLHNPLLCNCTPGLIVGLMLESNNVTGVLGEDLTTNVGDLLSLLSCSLRVLALQNNNLHGTLPETMTKLSHLWLLSLGYNHITGTIPAGIGHMAALEVLDLTANKVSGTIPTNLCGPLDDNNYTSPLTDLLIANNDLEGVLNLTKCVNLIMLDAANNQLNGVITDLAFYSQLHVVLLQGNQLQADYFRFDLAKTRVLTQLNIGHNRMKGTVPDQLGAQFYLTSLILEYNGLHGTLPDALFKELGSLSSLDLSDNFFNGSIPEGLGRTSSLMRLDLSNNTLTGPLPDSLAEFLALRQAYLDIRGTYMSCCGTDFIPPVNGTGGRYRTINYSLPRLPTGLAFSETLRPVNDMLSGNLSNLNCPFVTLAPNVNYSLLGNETKDQAPGEGEMLMSFYLNPEYTLFEQCQCDPGSTMVNDTLNQRVYCTYNGPAPTPWYISQWWIWLIVAVAAMCCVVLFLWFVFYRSTRPALIQNFLDMRKRLRGMPQSGRVSIVTTDIEGFSDMMKELPEATSKALLIHNSLMRKAMWTNFGYTIEQEGDSFTIIFSDPVDAVKFCLQVQQLLAYVSWPPGLFDGAGKDTPRKSSKGSGLSKSLWRRNRFKSPSLPLVSHHFFAATKAQGLERDNSSVNSTTTVLARKAKSHDPPATVQASSLSKLESAETSRPPSAMSPVPGLRVRIGVATGDILDGVPLTSSPVMELAKVVSDAASGGQVLMCGTTYQAVRGLARELGCVGVEGFKQSKLHNTAAWRRLWRPKAQQAEEAMMLHMGRYLHCTQGVQVPVMLPPLLLGLEAHQEPQPGRAFGRGAFADPPGLRQSAALRQSSGALQARALDLYQVLAPGQVSRGRWFGSRLALKSEWAPLDVPYFSAPGALFAPLTSYDFVAPGDSVPVVTMVFCMVDGGKLYAAKYRKDARDVHAKLVALMYSVLRQLPQGYYVKGHDGDLKYMVAFTDPKVALLWCLAVQECALYVDWPGTALRYWPLEREAGDRLLFRGPRLKMGLCEGEPRSIVPDCNGRADFLGDSVNQAARFMDAAAHGGQVVCQEALVLHLIGTTAPRSNDGTVPWATSTLGPPSQSGQQQPASSEQMALASLRSFRSDQTSEQASFQSDQPSLKSDHTSFKSERASTAHSRSRLETHQEGEENGSGELNGDSSGSGGGGAVPVAEGGEANGSCSGDSTQPPASGEQEEHAGDGGRPTSETSTGRAGAPEQLAASTSTTALAPSDLTPEQVAMATDTRASPGSVQDGAWSEVLAIRLGLFRFKGSSQLIPMTYVVQASLAGRRFPDEAPKGKGARVAVFHGVLAISKMPLLSIIGAYRQQHRSQAHMNSMTVPSDVNLASMGSLPGSSRQGSARSQVSLRRRPGEAAPEGAVVLHVAGRQ